MVHSTDWTTTTTTTTTVVVVFVVVVVVIGLTDIRSNVQQITSWVAKVGPLYSLDSGSAAGSLDMLEENHAELEHRLEEAAQLKEKAAEFIASLRNTEGQDGQEVIIIVIIISSYSVDKKLTYATR